MPGPQRGGRSGGTGNASGAGPSGTAPSNERGGGNYGGGQSQRGGGDDYGQPRGGNAPPQRSAPPVNEGFDDDDIPF